MTENSKNLVSNSETQEPTSSEKNLEVMMEKLLQALNAVSPEIHIEGASKESIQTENQLNSSDTTLVQRIEELYASNKSVSLIAEKLSEEYNRKITTDYVFSCIEKSVSSFEQLQNSHLKTVYPLICIDNCEYAHSSDRYGSIGHILYSIIGVTKSGMKECLGFWSCNKKKNQTFWNDLMTELRNRGVQDILVVLSEDTPELKRALKAMFPEALLFPSPGHQLLKISQCVNGLHVKDIIKSLKAAWLAESQQEGNELMDEFCKKWSNHYPLLTDYVSKSWTTNSTCLAFGDHILRQFLFNPSPAFKYSHVIKSAFLHKEIMPSSLAACKLAYLATYPLRKKWTVKITHWYYICQSLGKAFNNRFMLFE